MFIVFSLIGLLIVILVICQWLLVGVQTGLGPFFNIAPVVKFFAAGMTSVVL
jgi:hypothetical protein